MPKVSAEHREVRRAEIIDAAVRCFARAGYRRTSMADIIAESGLSAGAIYGYFTGKQQLLEGVTDHLFELRQADLAALRAGAGVATPAEVIVRLLDLIDEQGPPGVVVQLWGEATVEPEISAVVERTISRVRAMSLDLLANGERAGSGASAAPGASVALSPGIADVCVSIVQGYVLRCALGVDFDREGYREAVRAVIRERRPSRRPRRS